MVTTIQISDELWNWLNKNKERGESHENVLLRKLKIKLKKEVSKNVKENN